MTNIATLPSKSDDDCVHLTRVPFMGRGWRKKTAQKIYITLARIRGSIVLRNVALCPLPVPSRCMRTLASGDSREFAVGESSIQTRHWCDGRHRTPSNATAPGPSTRGLRQSKGDSSTRARPACRCRGHHWCAMRPRPRALTGYRTHRPMRSLSLSLRNSIYTGYCRYMDYM